MAESIITLGIGGSPNGLTPFITSGLNGRDIGDAKNIIMLGIGADPGGLVWFLTSGIQPIMVQRASRVYSTQRRESYTTHKRSRHQTDRREVDEL